MSFAENEQALLTEYLQTQAAKHYEISKIARFYLRFKYNENINHDIYVSGYRKSYFGHWYWQFSDKPLAPAHSYGSRLVYHLLAFIGLSLLFMASFGLLLKMDYHFLYSDGLMALLFTMPLLSFSFALDFLGRFIESCHYHEVRQRSLSFAKFRAIYLGLNMMFRYLLLFVIIVPAFLKELKGIVVFTIVCLLLYKVLYSYLPHRYRGRLLVMATIGAIFVCMVMANINDTIPYRKDQLNYDAFNMMHLEDFLDAKDFNEDQGYVRQVHRYTSTSVAVPLYFRRTETMEAIDHPQASYLAKSSFSYCRDAATADYVFSQIVAQLERDEIVYLDEQAWQVDWVLLVGKEQLFVKKGMHIYEFAASFDLSRVEVLSGIEEMIAENEKYALLS